MLKQLLHRRWVWFAGPALIALLLLFFSGGTESDSFVQTWADVRRGELLIDAVETGEVRAVRSVDLKAPMEWRMDLQIIDMMPEGSIVSEGDFLVQFDTSELLRRLEIARDQLTSVLAQRDKVLAEQLARLAQLQSEVTSAQYSRDIAVLQKELLQYEAAVRQQDAELEEKKAQIQLHEILTTLDSQKIIDASALSALKVEIGKARMEVEELQKKIDNLRLIAPIGGMVVYNEVGNWTNRKKVASGDKVRPGEAIVSIPNLQAMQVHLRVNEMDAARLQEDQQAVIFLDAYPDKQFSGRVTQIAKLAQKENWESMIKDFEIVVAVDEADEILKPGMTARVRIALKTLPDAVYVPLGTVYEEMGRAVVFPRKRYPRPLKVETGPRTDQYIVITGDGLKVDDPVAWRAPKPDYNRLGYAQNVEERTRSDRFLAQAFAEMAQRGLTYDYDGHRDKRVIARAEQGGLPPDAEKVRAQFKTMSGEGIPVEIDPRAMKQLQQTLRGMQPGVQGQTAEEKQGGTIRIPTPAQPAKQSSMPESAAKDTVTGDGASAAAPDSTGRKQAIFLPQR